jgi:hypothetical protein
MRRFGLSFICAVAACAFVAAAAISVPELRAIDERTRAPRVTRKGKYKSVGLAPHSSRWKRSRGARRPSGN